MPYPFSKMPTLGQFLDKATNKYNAKERKTSTVIGPKGQTKIRYLTRKFSRGKKLVATIPNIKNNERITPSVLRSLCNRLKIPLKEFDFDLT